MQFKNTVVSYGIVSILLHWLMAFLIIGLFILGQYMVDLDYYNSWYQLAPWWHKSLGFSVFILLMLRFFWRLNNINPELLINTTKYSRWEIKIAKIVHFSFYILLLIISISGYFIATAKGQVIDFFSIFKLPHIYILSEQQASIAATTHELATQILIYLVVLHSLAALKHHFINHDLSLVRILKVINNREKKL